MTVETVEGEVVDEQRHELAVREPAGLAVTPQVQADELVQRLDVIRDAAKKAMEEGIDYGRIPGVEKPSLFKPGAEKLGVLFQLDIQLENEKVWGPGDHLTVVSRATVFHAPSGTRLGFGEGVCSTRERKYAYRRQERVCPACGAAAVIKGKAEFGGGWLCWKKKDGCGAKFADGDPTVESQQVGDVDNPDLPDCWNTVVKMSEKRARVDAVLAVTGASALFTQDAEDLAAAEPKSSPENPTLAGTGAQGSGPGGGGTISKQQQKLIFARANAEGLSEETVKRLLSEVCGVESTGDVPKDRLDDLLAAIESAGVPFV